MRKEITARLLVLALALTMVLGGAALPADVWADSAQTPGVHYIAVASDRHDTPEAIGAAMGDMPESVEYVCLNGDMTDSARPGTPPPPPTAAPAEPPEPGSGNGVRRMTQKPYNTSTLLGEVQGVFPELDSDDVAVIYAAHDACATDDADIIECADTSLLPSETESDVPEISAGRSGLIHTGYDGDEPAYYVYGVSYYDMVNTGLDAESGEYGAGGKTSAEAFMKFADEHPGVPVIAVGHVPLHAKRNDNLAASFWSDAFNYAATGSAEGTEIKRDVVYLSGHNHTVEMDSESGKAAEYYVEPGGALAVQGTEKDQFTEGKIYYTYMTAGYLRDNVTSTLVRVEDGSLSFEKYSGCKVIFDTGGGNDIKSQTVKTGGYAKEPRFVYRDGYDFTGWYKEAGCVNRWEFYEDAVDQDTTIYAGWTGDWGVDSLSFTPVSDTVKMSQIYERDNDGIPALNLANRASNLSGSQAFFMKGDSCIVRYKDGSEKKFVYDKKRGVSYADFKANDGTVIQLEALATELSKEVRASGEGSADDLAAASGKNELTVEYMNNDTGRFVRDGFSLNVTEDIEHNCADAIRTCNACEPGCENTGMSADCHRCQICNKYYSDLEAKKEISRESVLLPALGHAWDEGTVTEGSSRRNEGVKTYSCTREGCRATYAETIGADGHSYSAECSSDESRHWHSCTDEECGKRDSFGRHNWMTQTSLPSCTKAGEKYYVCSICGVREKGTTRITTPAAGHSFGEWKTVSKPTELAAGQRQHSCKVCGFTEKETLAKLKPSLKAVTIVSPKAGKKSATVKWKKISKKDQKKIKKVEIQYGTDKKFAKNVKTVTAASKKTSKKITGLKKGKTYYVRVRTRSGDHISKWSKTKKFKSK